ncbi:hypothetical protein D9758_003565 [Tetrapyrgos nigripes]|uniref:Polyketide synthase n=1 Tax=Tetrapyrgos nigripes TaxID=182062 RepID=A0A8H5GUZ5_9AGAR|nr:hypothetical protein D9758_003565 [Tetrapyrgos nigripes]
MANYAHDALAIVGIAAELPSGTESVVNLDYNEFIQFLLNGKESYERIPEERFSIDQWKGSQPGRIPAENGSFLKDIDLFDHIEFGITAKDVRAMPVSSRKLLELSFLALLDAGINYRTQNIGCFTSGINFETLQLSDIDVYEAQGSFAGIPAQVANKISYHLDLLGPSVPTDTACSSTLTAMHLAALAIHSGECKAAVVGGAQINQRLLDFVQYSQSGVLSADGKCKPFDAKADGFSRGEGAVVVIIKPLTEALVDNDKIYGTILGTGISSTGCAAPAYAPVAAAQEDAMQRAYKMAQRRPREADFVELHATGTAQGDPTEANWVGKSFQRDGKVVIGSVKGNIGHLEISSFLASLCKVCGIFETGIIPPNMNVSTPNPAIKWKEYQLEVPLCPTKLVIQSDSGRALVSISSSGIGGSTGHCVLEGPPKLPLHTSTSMPSRVPVLLVAGGLSPRSLSAVAESLENLVRLQPQYLDSISVIYGRRARQMIWRSFAVIDDRNDIKIRFSHPSLAPRSKPPVGFVFSGQGPQHLRMGSQLFAFYPSFRNTILELDAVYQRITGQSLISSTGLFDAAQHKTPVSLAEVWPISITLPAICMVQIAMHDLLISMGVQPDFIIGHSAGETALLYASGAASKSMAMEIAICRGQSLASTEEMGGSMAALSCSCDKAKELVSQLDTPDIIVDIACINTDDSVTVAGHSLYIDSLVALCKAQGIAAQKLRTNVAVHSGFMDACKNDYMTRIKAVFDRNHGPFSPTVNVYSTVTGNLLKEDFSAEYFWDNTRLPVRFSDAVHSAQETRADQQLVFIEIGAHPVLSAYLSTICPNSNVISTMRRTKQMTENFELTVFLKSLGSFVTAGFNTVDFSALNNGASPYNKSFPLPSYPFSKKKVPSMSPFLGQDNVLIQNGPLNSQRLRMNFQTHPDMAEHVMNGEPILPATGFIEMALELGANMLWDVKFHSFLSLSNNEPIAVFVKTDGMCWSVKTQKSGYDATKVERLHADGYLSTEPAFSKEVESLDVLSICARCEEVSVEGFYSDLRYFAEYGPNFQMIRSCHRSETEFLVQIDTKRVRSTPKYDYRIDPAVLDACIHVMVHPLLTGNADQKVYYLPSGFKRFFLYESGHEKITDVLYAHGSNAYWAPETLSYDVLVVNSDGHPICLFREFTVSAHAIQPNAPVHYSMNAIPCGSIHTMPRSETYSPDNLPYDSQRCLIQKDAIIYAYLRGTESFLQGSLETIDINKPKTLWIFALAGPDGGAALGFSRSLRRELLSMRVRTVIHDTPVSTADDFRDIISQLDAEGLDEDELILRADGWVLIHRLREVRPSQDSGLRREQETSISNGRKLVHVDYIQEDAHNADVWGFSGRTQDGQLVAGIYQGPVVDQWSSPDALFAPVEYRDSQNSEALASAAAGSVLSLVIGRLALDELPSDISRNGGQATALITHTDTLLGTSLVSFFTSREFSVTTLDSISSIASLLSIESTSGFDIVLSGLTDQSAVQILTAIAKDPSGVFLWNDSIRGIRAHIQRHSARLLRALHAAVEDFSRGTALKHGCPIDSLTPSTTSPNIQETGLFDAEKAYILFGGVGSLGLRIACWMYANGARNIVVTSRSGRESLVRTKNYPALRVMRYLEGLEDLTLSVESSDVTSIDALRALLAKQTCHIGGCMLLAAVLEDQPFTATTPSPDSFDRVFASKVGAFDVLRKVINISTLDFVICFTSISGLFGSAGQTNYAAANTALEATTEPYNNTFCFVAPVVLDTSIVFGDPMSKTIYNTKIRHITEWGMSTDEICQYLGDGLRRMKTNPFTLYIPPFDFNLVKNNLGVSPMFAHLIEDESTTLSSASGNFNSTGKKAEVTPKDVVLKVLDMIEEDFSSEVPLVSYGLDSLLAARLSLLLRRWAPITQLQLLADMTFDDISSRVQAASSSSDV